MYFFKLSYDLKTLYYKICGPTYSRMLDISSCHSRVILLDD
jgi:hypothetical protein